MPRANRHFLPGHVWHVTKSPFQSFQPFNRFAPFKPVAENENRTSIGTQKDHDKLLSDSSTGLTSIAQSLSIGLDYQ